MKLLILTVAGLWLSHLSAAELNGIELNGIELNGIELNKMRYWQQKVRAYPELSEPKIVLSWHLFAKSKKHGEDKYLANSCDLLNDALKINLSYNGVKLGVALANYQHDFETLEKLSRYHLSRWPYDTQVLLWRLQGALATNNKPLINSTSLSINALPDDDFTRIAKADIAGFNKQYTKQVQLLKKALPDNRNKEDKRSLQAWLWLQIAAIYMDKLDDLALVNQALVLAEQLNPEDPNIIRHRIEWLILTEDLKQANNKLIDLRLWYQHPELDYFAAILEGENRVVTNLHASNKAVVCQLEFKGGYKSKKTRNT